MTQCAIATMYANFLWMGDARVTLSETVVSCVGGTLMLYVYSVQPWLCRFSRRMPSVDDASTPTAAEWPRGLPPRLHSSPWCIRTPGIVHMADTFQFRQSALITTQVLLFLSVMTCHSLTRTQANPLCLSENLIS